VIKAEYVKPYHYHKSYECSACSFLSRLQKLGVYSIEHAKASHWLEDGMNIVQISFLLGHANLQTTMMYLDITTEQASKALATLEDEDK
jgi:site-specific recombinase XerD